MKIYSFMLQNSMRNQTLVKHGMALADQLTADHLIASKDTAVAYRLAHTPQLLATLIAGRQPEKDVDPEAIVSLVTNIEAAFNLSELNDLCLRAGVEFENVSGVTKSDKVRELVRLMQRHGRLLELVTVCQQLRPKQQWGHGRQ